MKKECTLEEELLVDLGHGSRPFDIFEATTGVKKLLDTILTKTNRYAAQKDCNFETMAGEMKAFLGINLIMGINRLPSFENYWSTDKYIGNKKIKNFITGTRFQSILENLHSSNNDNDNKTDESYNNQISKQSIR